MIMRLWLKLIKSWWTRSWTMHTVLPCCFGIRADEAELLAIRIQDDRTISPGQERWIEATIPPRGLPRALQLALKDNGAWELLAFH
jgi:hypothetical protein